MSGIKIYADPNFTGRSDILAEKNYPSIPSSVKNDRISSIRIPNGYYAHFYQHSNFAGEEFVLFKGNYKNLTHWWNDAISSIKVFKHNDRLFPAVQFYTDPNFTGRVQNIAGTGKETKYRLPFFQNDTISSMKVPKDVSIILFDNPNFKGKKKEFSTGNYHNLREFGWDDKVSSIKIISKLELELIQTDYLNTVSSPNGDPIAISCSIKNETDILQSTALTLNSAAENSVTHSFSNSTSIGFSVSTSASATVTKGILSTELSTTISSSLESSFTIGKTNSKSESIGFSKTVTINVPPKSKGTVKMTLTPKKTKVKVRYLFKVKGLNETMTTDADILIQQYQEGDVIIQAKALGK